MPRSDLDIDFEEASRQWMRNKVRVGQQYKYRCECLTKDGRNCSRYAVQGEPACKIHARLNSKRRQISDRDRHRQMQYYAIQRFKSEQPKTEPSEEIEREEIEVEEIEREEPSVVTEYLLLLTCIVIYIMMCMTLGDIKALDIELTH